jgi:cellulose biosynthesis protein BcsQ
MSIPVLTFFNNKGGVGKTSLVYHVAWMLNRIGHRVLACDLDPQANLTAAFLSEARLEDMWNAQGKGTSQGHTIYECVRPLTEMGDVLPPVLAEITPNLSLVPGDLGLASFEDILSTEWPNALGSRNLLRPLRIQTAFSHVVQHGARTMKASVVVADVGPNLGAINRSALIATDHVVVPLGADLFSLQGLRNLGPALRGWRKDWQMRKQQGQDREVGLSLPDGNMYPIGYVVQQHGVRLSRPVKAYDKWVNRMPGEYAKSLLQDEPPYAPMPSEDGRCLATVKHFRSLVPMAQEARKPIFDLTPADGAIGGHAAAVRQAFGDFHALSLRISSEIDLDGQSEQR